MNLISEDYTASVLRNIPVFCLNRFYTTEEGRDGGLIVVQYRFKFPNDYGASVVQFKDRSFSGGQDYELGVLKYEGEHHGLVYDTPITGDVERGDATYINELLNLIEKLGSLSMDEIPMLKYDNK